MGVAVRNFCGTVRFPVYFPQSIGLPDKAGLLQSGHGDAVGIHDIDAVCVCFIRQIKVIGTITVVPLLFLQPLFPVVRAAQQAALQAALVDACEVPLEIMRQCVQVVESCVFLAKHGSVLAVSDAGAGAVLAKAALLAASLNVRINIASMDDAVRAEAYREEMEELIAAGSALADDVYADVVERLG